MWLKKEEVPDVIKKEEVPDEIKRNPMRSLTLM